MTLHPTIVDWLFAREALRRLGFPAEDLFFVVALSGMVMEAGQVKQFDEPIIGVELRHAGKVFSWTIGTMHGTKDEINAAYEAACAAWNAGIGFSDDDFFASKAFRSRMALIAALQAKGIPLPNARSPRAQA